MTHVTSRLTEPGSAPEPYAREPLPFLDSGPAFSVDSLQVVTAPNQFASMFKNNFDLNDL